MLGKSFHTNNSFYVGTQSLSIQFNAIILTILSRSLRKTSHILLALSHLVDEKSSTPPITYYALDLDKPELERTLAELTASDVGLKLQGKVATKGIWGTYDEGLKFIREGGIHGRGSAGTRSSESGSGSDTTTTPLHILFIGSSLGHFPRGDDADFLRGLPLRPGSGDTFLLGLDHNDNPTEIERAYGCDSLGITRSFMMQGKFLNLAGQRGLTPR